MKQLEQFFLLIDQCLNDTKFIRKHALSEKDTARRMVYHALQHPRIDE